MLACGYHDWFTNPEAVHRYYESRRRVLFTDKKPERAEIVLKNKRKSKITQGQRRVYHLAYMHPYSMINMQLYDARSKFVKPCEEKYWHKLSFTCMSEEESATKDENNDKYIIRHSPNWRSAGKELFCLNTTVVISLDMILLISKLDKRLLKSSKLSGKNFTRLRRKDGEPIFCVPPPGVPKWAVDSTLRQSDSDIDVSSSVGTSDLGSSSVAVSTEVDSDVEDSDFAIEESRS